MIDVQVAVDFKTADGTAGKRDSRDQGNDQEREQRRGEHQA